MDTEQVDALAFVDVETTGLDAGHECGAHEHAQLWRN